MNESGTSSNICIPDPSSNLEASLESIDALNFKKDTLEYTACYCEENIYKLCEKIKEKTPELLPFFHVLFISNENRSVPLWQQKIGRGDDKMVIWDYHVILLYKSKEHSVVYDFDTLLPFPSPLDIYILKTFKPNLLLKDEYQPFFRFVPADVYLNLFESDRSHMLKEDGTYIAEPPRYRPITRGGSNLQSFIRMKNKVDQYGEVLSSHDFYDSLFPGILSFSYT